MAAIIPQASSGRPKEPEREKAVGNFIRMEQIGQGSFANVYKARHVRDPPSLALSSLTLGLPLYCLVIKC